MKPRLCKSDLVQQLNEIYDLKSQIVNVKASLKSIGFIDGGADTLIDALLECVGKDGTIVTDSFVRSYPIYSFQLYTTVVDENTPSYAGALANAMIKREESYRSEHPVQKFCAIGKYAKELCHSHNRNSYAYQVLQDISLMGGINLKIGSDYKVPGVGTTHVAVGNLAFRQLRLPRYVRYKDINGLSKFFRVNWSGLCLCTLTKLVPYYDQNNCLLATGNLGSAPVKITNMSQTLALETELIRKNPSEFLTCSDLSNTICSSTWENIGPSPFALSLHHLLNFKLRLAINYLFVQLFYRYPFD